MKIILLSLMLILSSCSLNKKLKNYPNLDQDKISYSVAIVTVGKTWFLNEFERCKSGKVICIDPPPLALESKLIKVIVGKELPAQFTIATTDHYAGDVYEMFTKNQLWLVKIKSDGQGFIMPRYAR